MRNKGLWQSKDDVILMRPNTQADQVSRAVQVLYYPSFRRDLFDNFIKIRDWDFFFTMPLIEGN